MFQTTNQMGFIENTDQHHPTRPAPPGPRLDEAGRQAADLGACVVEMRHVPLEGPTFQDGSDVADVQAWAGVCQIDLLDRKKHSETQNYMRWLVVYLYIYIYMWQGPFGIMRTIACFKHPTPASVLVPFLSPCLPPCSLQLVPLLLFLPLSCCPSLCMYILDAQVSLFSICLRACLPLFSSGSVLSFLPNH